MAAREDARLKAGRQRRTREPHDIGTKRTGETKWQPSEDARLKAGRQRRTRQPHNIGTVRSHWNTGAAPGTCTGPEAAIRTSGKGDQRKELRWRAKPGGDAGTT
ncbi:hypothetical protein NDU88_005982 [Pleurodeles waltl]|uniref:Uncharacterized protein n=1 Tax=Pleurodeles waltl TaxID=8319 RepID=A0AAV7TDT1_PLEWA|nr:hypothetical protein NDU88_005982 [Pleurodeles waltl]